MAIGYLRSAFSGWAPTRLAVHALVPHPAFPLRCWLSSGDAALGLCSGPVRQSVSLGYQTAVLDLIWLAPCRSRLAECGRHGSCSVGLQGCWGTRLQWLRLGATCGSVTACEKPCGMMYRHGMLLPLETASRCPEVPPSCRCLEASYSSSPLALRRRGMTPWHRGWPLGYLGCLRLNCLEMYLTPVLRPTLPWQISTLCFCRHG